MIIAKHLSTFLVDTIPIVRTNIERQIEILNMKRNIIQKSLNLFKVAILKLLWWYRKATAWL